MSENRVLLIGSGTEYKGCLSLKWVDRLCWGRELHAEAWKGTAGVVGVPCPCSCSLQAPTPLKFLNSVPENDIVVPRGHFSP